MTTLHDATFFTHPEVHQPVKRQFFRAWTKASLRCAAPPRRDPVAATRDELVRVTGAGAGPVDVAHHGVDPARFHVPCDAERAAVRAHLGLRSAATWPSSGRSSRARTCRRWSRAGCRPSPGSGRPAGAGARRRAGLGRPDRPRRRPRSPPGSTLLRPATCRWTLLPGFLGERRGGRLSEPGGGLRAAGARGDGLRRGRADHPPTLACRRSAGTPSTTPSRPGRDRRASGLLADPDRRARAGGGGDRAGGAFDWRACARAHLASYAAAAEAADDAASGP